MTGWLAASGIAIILLASLYTGLAASTGGTNEELHDRLVPTATAEATGPADDPSPEEATAGPEDGDTAAGPEDSQDDSSDGNEGADPAGQTEAAATPPSEQAPPPIQVFNRQDCEKIRGTQYLSVEERTWYLANCARR